MCALVVWAAETNWSATKGGFGRPSPFRLTARAVASVAVDLHEPFVRDAEVVGDLVQDDAPNLALEDRLVPAREALQRASEDRDLVRQRARVVAAARRQRHALVQPEQRMSGRRL